MKTVIQIRRVYDDPGGQPSDGFRVFVDRLWPRGESKEKFHYDLWAKDVAPSTELRRWFHADPAGRAAAFEARYRAELDANPAVRELAARIGTHAQATLLYAASDTQHNNAAVLADYLSGILSESGEK